MSPSPPKRSGRDGSGTGRSDSEDQRYERLRRKQVNDRARREREGFDPRAPEDADWTAEEGDHLRIITPPSPLGDALSGFVTSRRWQQRLRGAAVHNHWEEIVGAELIARCQPVRLAGGVLVVRAESAAWATQLRYMTTQLRDQVNRVLGEDMVSEVQITVGRLGE